MKTTQPFIGTQQTMNKILMGLSALGIVFISACHSNPKNDPLNPNAPIPAQLIPERQTVPFQDILYREDAKDFSCPAVYQPVCLTIKQNGQTFQKTFSNQCMAKGVLNVEHIQHGSCE